MKHSKAYLGLTFLFACAVSLAMILEDATLVDAKGLPRTLFSSSPLSGGKGGKDKSRAPSQESKGEFEPGQGGEDKPVIDPEAPGFNVFFPKDAVDEPAKVKFVNSGRPQHVPVLPNTAAIPNSIVPNSTNSPYFLFAVWRRAGEGGAIREFKRSIFINVPYDDQGLGAAQEEKMHMWMYNPVTQAWTKLGGRVDIFNNVITGMLAETTPLEENGNTLFSLAVDDTPNLQQSVDNLGKTTLSIPGKDDFRFHVLPGTVEVGSHFEVTILGHWPATNSVKLLTAPVDIKACFIDYTTPNHLNDRQITKFPKPISVEFDYQAAGLTNVGNPANLTIVTLRHGQWVDVETLGYKVTRQGHKIVVETDKLGTFGLAAK